MFRLVLWLEKLLDGDRKAGLFGLFLSRFPFSIYSMLRSPPSGGRLVGRASWWRDSANPVHEVCKHSRFLVETRGLLEVHSLLSLRSGLAATPVKGLLLLHSEEWFESSHVAYIWNTLYIFKSFVESVWHVYPLRGLQPRQLIFIYNFLLILYLPSLPPLLHLHPWQLHLCSLQ